MSLATWGRRAWATTVRPLVPSPANIREAGSRQWGTPNCPSNARYVEAKWAKFSERSRFEARCDSISPELAGELRMMTRRRSISLWAVATVASLPLSLQAAVARAEDSPSELKVPDVPNIAAAMSERLHGDPAFAGLELIEGGKIRVHATDQSSTAELRLLDGIPAALVEFVPAKFRLSDLTAQQLRVREAAFALDAAGIKLAHWGPDIASNSLRIGVVGPTADIERVLRSRFGPEISVIAAERPEIVSASRLDDISPFNGGVIIATDLTDCSGGPTVKNAAGRRFMITAGHCYLNGLGSFPKTARTFPTYNDSRVISAPGEWMGYAAAERVNGGYDLATIETPVSKLNWRSGPIAATAPKANQVGAETSVLGGSVCASGAPSGEQCGAIVSAVKQDIFSFDTRVHINMSAAQRGCCIGVVGKGDSGGPVYRVNSVGGLVINGFIVARDRTGGSAAQMACGNGDQYMRDNDEFASYCTGTVWYHDMPSVLAHTQLSLVVS